MAPGRARLVTHHLEEIARLGMTRPWKGRIKDVGGNDIVERDAEITTFRLSARGCTATISGHLRVWRDVRDQTAPNDLDVVWTIDLSKIDRARSNFQDLENPPEVTALGFYGHGILVRATDRSGTREFKAPEFRHGAGDAPTAYYLARLWHDAGQLCMGGDVKTYEVMPSLEKITNNPRFIRSVPDVLAWVTRQANRMDVAVSGKGVKDPIYVRSRFRVTAGSCALTYQWNEGNQQQSATVDFRTWIEEWPRFSPGFDLGRGYVLQTWIAGLSNAYHGAPSDDVLEEFNIAYSRLADGCLAADQRRRTRVESSANYSSRGLRTFVEGLPSLLPSPEELAAQAAAKVRERFLTFYSESDIVNIQTAKMAVTLDGCVASIRGIRSNASMVPLQMDLSDQSCQARKEGGDVVVCCASGARCIRHVGYQPRGTPDFFVTRWQEMFSICRK
jgi:hypothetical protein